MIKEQLDFRTAMRRLWEEHVTWTRMLLISIAAGLPDADLVTKRLLKNQEDIGNAIKPFYGESVGNRFADLLKAHILIAIKVILATKFKDGKGFDGISTQWFANADKMAAFLSSVNPYWAEDAVKAMLYDHLNLTSEQVFARLNGKYDEDIAAFDEVHDQALMTADMLSVGIEKRFTEAPQK